MGIKKLGKKVHYFHELWCFYAKGRASLAGLGQANFALGKCFPLYHHNPRHNSEWKNNVVKLTLMLPHRHGQKLGAKFNSRV